MLYVEVDPVTGVLKRNSVQSKNLSNVLSVDDVLEGWVYLTAGLDDKIIKERVKLCPFNAISFENGRLDISSACKCIPIVPRWRFL